MRRLFVVIGAVGLLVLSTVSVFADKPTRNDIKTLGVDTTDFCGTSASNPTVGRLQINRKGKSKNGGAFHVQVKVESGPASTNYDMQLARQVVVIDPLTNVQTTVCQLTAVGALKTNPQGKGVRNFKFNLADGQNSDTFKLVLDAAAGGTDLGTANLTLDRAQ